ncbi:hypothetical protein IE53DRAFT_386180 [Violaceomyces palustris]|uniref:Uncharacterized protein n=1 Tax=Violaceomyces palustris TaxID=1673888 RepID=A0ACD0P070_9BASI|nr:hypothetical protein IE53DRAFT_386180 [Violaceomyces palustris]
MEAEKEKREMEKIERAAMESYSLDLASASSVISKPPAAGSPSDTTDQVDEKGGKREVGEKAQEWKPTDKLAAYSTPESLGFVEDPEVKRKKEEEEARKEAGFAGEWEVIPQAQPSNSLSQPGASYSATELSPFVSDRQKARSFALKERSAPSVHEPEDDLGEIKVKKRIKVESRDDLMKREEEARSRMLPAWTSIKLERGGSTQSPKLEVGDQESEDSKGSPPNPVEVKERPVESVPENQSKEDTAVKLEDKAAASSEREGGASLESVQQVKAEEDSNAGGGGGGGLFKKRKAGVGAGAKRVRALV